MRPRLGYDTVPDLLSDKSIVPHIVYWTPNIVCQLPRFLIGFHTERHLKHSIHGIGSRWRLLNGHRRKFMSMLHRKRYILYWCTGLQIMGILHLHFIRIV